MAESDRNQYTEALHQFSQLTEQPFSSSKYLDSLVDVQTAGFRGGLKLEMLFTHLRDFSRTAVERAAEATDKEAEARFRAMQEGYQLQLDRLSPPQTQPQVQPKTSRPLTRVASG